MVNPLLDPAARIVVAHRGNRVAHPENTLESLQSAVDLGVDALEFDVRMSADGVPVVIHDAELVRTTGASGLVRERTLAELRALNAASAFAGHAPLTIPTLEEVLDQFRAVPLVIEIKEMAAAEPTERLVRRFEATERIVVGSSHDSVAQRLYRTGLACCASTFDAIKLIPSAVFGSTPARGRYQVLSITPVYYGIPIPVYGLVKVAGKARLPVHVWTVNTPDEAVRYWDAGVSAILTDDPDAILRVRPH